MANITWGEIPESIIAEQRERQTALYEKLAVLRNTHHVPIEPAFWSAVQTADGKIRNNEDYVSCFGTAGLHHTLSVRTGYNPYQVAYDRIVSNNLNGWEERVNVPNAFSGTSYYMFRVDATFYLVYTNSSDEVNEVEDNYWLTHVTLVEPDAGSPPGGAPTD
jgi:hypothetical protein